MLSLHPLNILRLIRSLHRLLHAGNIPVDHRFGLHSRACADFNIVSDNGDSPGVTVLRIFRALSDNRVFTDHAVFSDDRIFNNCTLADHGSGHDDRIAHNRAGFDGHAGEDN